MSGHPFLDLLAGVALLLWATRLVKTGMMRAFGEGLRRAIAHATSNRFVACLSGIGVAGALQSSTASSLLVVSFAERGFLSLPTALAVLLGANIGTTLVVQALSFDVSALMPLLMIAGVVLFLTFQSAKLRNVGRCLIGLGLMILSLKLVTNVAAPIRGSEILLLVFQRLSDEPILSLAIGAALAWLVHSSVAILLLVMSLAGAGVLDLRLALVLALGANIGSGLAPLGLSLRGSIEAKRILIGNLATRILGALLLVPFIAWVVQMMAGLESDPARTVANFHTAFNILLSFIFLPLIDLLGKGLRKTFPDPVKPVGERALEILDEMDFDRPSVALAAASREVMRLAELVEVMLRESIYTFEETDDSRRKQISSLDQRVDELQESIKLYLTRMTRNPLAGDISRKAFDLILFTTNLEHVGDILDKTLLAVAAKKQRLQVKFSDEGWRDIKAMHHEVIEQMRLAVAVFLTQDVEMARRLVLAKDRIRVFERLAAESHLHRLQAGTLASIETSSLHLDIIRDLKRIVAHLTSVAYPILEAEGELSTSRLRGQEAS